LHGNRPEERQAAGRLEEFGEFFSTSFVGHPYQKSSVESTKYPPLFFWPLTITVAKKNRRAFCWGPIHHPKNYR